MKGQPRKKGRIVSEAEFRRMWEDMSISRAEIGRRLGISGYAVLCRAMARGFEPRPSARIFARRFDHALIVRLYRAGLSKATVADVVGCSESVVLHAMRSAGAEMRGKHDARAVTKSEFICALMSARAREEQAALANAKMVDVVIGNRRRAA